MLAASSFPTCTFVVGNRDELMVGKQCGHGSDIFVEQVRSAMREVPVCRAGQRDSGEFQVFRFLLANAVGRECVEALVNSERFSHSGVSGPWLANTRPS